MKKMLMTIAAAAMITFAAAPAHAASSWTLDLSLFSSVELEVMGKVASMESISVGFGSFMSYESLKVAADGISECIMEQDNDTMLAEYLCRQDIDGFQAECPNGVVITFNAPMYPNTLKYEMYGNADIEAFISCVISESGVAADMSVEEKTARISDWFAGNMSYDKACNRTDTRDAAITRRGVCYQMAKLFTYVCKSCGVPCSYVNGYFGGEGHAWVVIQTENGRYSVDPGNMARNRQRCFYMLNAEDAAKAGYTEVRYGMNN